MWFTLYNIQNFIDFNNTISKDQVVSIYINHLVDFQQHYLHIEYLFNSGILYNRKCDRVYVNETMNIYGKSLQQFDFISLFF